MTTKKYDEDLFEFFSKLLDNEKELLLLKNIMSGKSYEEIIKEFIDSLETKAND